MCQHVSRSGLPGAAEGKTCYRIKKKSEVWEGIWAINEERRKRWKWDTLEDECKNERNGRAIHKTEEGSRQTKNESKCHMKVGRKEGRRNI